MNADQTLFVYSQGNCPACVSLKERLMAANTDFNEVRIDKDPAGLQFLKDKGIRTVPVMFRDGVQVKVI